MTTNSPMTEKQTIRFGYAISLTLIFALQAWLAALSARIYPARWQLAIAAALLLLPAWRIWMIARRYPDALGLVLNVTLSFYALIGALWWLLLWK